MSLHPTLGTLHKPELLLGLSGGRKVRLLISRTALGGRTGFPVGRVWEENRGEPSFPTPPSLSQRTRSIWWKRHSAVPLWGFRPGRPHPVAPGCLWPRIPLHLPWSIVQGTKVLWNLTSSFCCAPWAGSTVSGTVFSSCLQKQFRSSPTRGFPTPVKLTGGPQFSQLWMRRASSTAWWTSIASASLLTLVQNRDSWALPENPWIRIAFGNPDTWFGVSQVVLGVKNLPAKAGDLKDSGLIPQLGRSLEEGMTTHSSILAWRIPRTEEAGGNSTRGHKKSDTTEAT